MGIQLGAVGHLSAKRIHELQRCSSQDSTASRPVCSCLCPVLEQVLSLRNLVFSVVTTLLRLQIRRLSQLRMRLSHPPQTRTLSRTRKPQANQPKQTLRHRNPVLQQQRVDYQATRLCPTASSSELQLRPSPTARLETLPTFPTFKVFQSSLRSHQPSQSQVLC